MQNNPSMFIFLPHKRSVNKRNLIPFFFILALFSCKTIRVIESPGEHMSEVRKQYIEKYNKLAISEMKRSGVPASITLAQGILESDNGTGRLAKKANNHFGIKCHDSWKGRKIYHDDDRKKECFRKYSNAAESYRDHSDFLRNSNRYASLFNLDRENYKGWARGLKKAGYATDNQYDKLLIKIIEENRLYQYDNLKRAKRKAKDKKPGKEDELIAKPTSGNKETNLESEDVNNPGSRISKRNRIDFFIVSEGDTYRSLEKEFGMMHWELFKYNDLPEDFLLKKGMIMYLQPKRNKAAVGNDFHFVEKGETMHSISQKYGIKLDQLYKLNRIKAGEKPVPGNKLWLRKVRPQPSNHLHQIPGGMELYPSVFSREAGRKEVLQNHYQQLFSDKIDHQLILFPAYFHVVQG